MKITIRQNEHQTQTEIVIHCRETDDEVLMAVAALSRLNKKLTGTKDGRTFVVDPADVLYFDSVDRKTFAYTKSEVYEMPLRLYELEGKLPRDFFRASKSSIINIGEIKSILPDFGGRIEVTLTTDEKLMVSRQYAHDLKTKLEL